VEHIDFHISYQCNNKCIFCSSSNSISEHNSICLKLEEVCALLLKKRKLGFQSINLTGGEPTFYPDFIPLVKFIKKLGYRIYVGTNGGNFVNKDFCSVLAPLIDEVCFSCHGLSQKDYTKITNSRYSFLRLKKALGNLSPYPIKLSVNVVVIKHNFLNLQRILSFLVKNKIERVLISNLAPEGQGLINYDKLLVRLEEIRKKIHGLVSFSNKNNLLIKFFGLPACVLGEYACYSNDFCWDERLNIELGKGLRLKEEKCWLPTRGRIKAVKCTDCLYNDICGGIFEEYFKRFGDGELKVSEK